MKIAPVMRALGEFDGVEQQLVHSGQHYDRGLSDVFFDDLEMPYPDYFLGTGSGTHTQQTARTALRLEPILKREKPAALIVPGDVNSTLGGALAAVHSATPAVHLEAGLRSFDRSMPEEHNRVLADHIADLLLTPSRDADENLLREGVVPDRIAFVGNVMIDSLRRHEARARELDVASELGAQDYVLVTLHRPSLVDNLEALIETMDALERVACDRPVLFPVHPRTESRLEAANWHPARVRLLKPQGYLRFLSLLTSAHCVLTDSGGLQEETTVFGIPCFTLRTTTERPITVEVGTNSVLGLGADGLNAFVCALDEGVTRGGRVPEKWDGNAAQRVAATVVRRYADPAVAAPRPSGASTTIVHSYKG